MNSRFLGSFFLICTLPCLGQARSKAYAGPSALGPYELERGYTMTALFDRLKLSPVKQLSPICFRSTDGTYMWAERMGVDVPEERKLVGRVFLSTFPNCVRNRIYDTPEAVGKWKTKEGIGLGNTKQDILRTYGKPSEDNMIKGNLYLDLIVGGFQGGNFTFRPRPDIGEEVWEYSEADTLRSAAFGLRSGIVIWVSISENP